MPSIIIISKLSLFLRNVIQLANNALAQTQQTAFHVNQKLQYILVQLGRAFQIKVVLKELNKINMFVKANAQLFLLIKANA